MPKLPDNLSEYGDIKAQGLRKVRSRMIIEALSTGDSVRGNIKVVKFGKGHDTRLEFYYRDTLILAYFIHNPMLYEIPNEYEDTASTRNQREMARQAIAEVFGVPA